MRWVSLVLLCSLAACGGAISDQPVIRLVDVFADANVEGSATPTATIPRTEWTFTAPTESNAGWKSVTGVSGLAVRDGKLTGRATTALPVVHVQRTGDLGGHDVLHEVVVRVRASAGTNLAVDLFPAEELDLERRLQQRREHGWNLTTPLSASDELQTYRISASSGIVPSYPSASIGHLILRPTDEAGAEFEIESVRLVFRKEHLAGIPAGVGWHGLGDIFRETIVSRSPERIELELTVPRQSFLELTLGTVEDAPVTFSVEAGRSQGGEGIHLLSRTLTTPNRWEPQYLDLSSLAGERVTLTLSLSADEAGSIGFWGAPVIRSAGTRRHPDAPQGVIIVLLDSLRSDHLKMYGYERETAPTLTRLAHEGALFRDVIAQGSWTKVSVPSFLTSTYPTVNGIFDRPHRLPASATTLAEAFRDAGYATWHSSSVPFTGRNSNLHQGVEVLHEYTSFEIPEGQNRVKTARLVADRLLPWIDAHRNVPFFVFFHAMDPH
ncbi:MAG: sulfatase-like hydrolase/transferase, partial [Pseudomonadales bacterium]